MTVVSNQQVYSGMSLDQYNEAIYQKVLNDTSKPMFNGFGFNNPVNSAFSGYGSAVPYGKGNHMHYNEGVYGVIKGLDDALKNNEGNQAWKLLKDMSPEEIANTEVGYFQATGRSLRKDLREHTNSMFGQAGMSGGFAVAGSAIGTIFGGLPGAIIGGAIGTGIGTLMSALAGPSTERFMEKLDKGTKAGSGSHSALALKDALDADDEIRAQKILKETPDESRPELEAYYQQFSGGKTLRQDIREHHISPILNNIANIQNLWLAPAASSEEMIDLLNEGQRYQYERSQQYQY
jgi:hypothetical protein